MKPFKQQVEKILGDVDVTINGSRPWDITVHNEALYQRVLSQGSMGLGEAYMDGWWDCDELDEFFNKILSDELDSVHPEMPLFQE